MKDLEKSKTFKKNGGVAELLKSKFAKRTGCNMTKLANQAKSSNAYPKAIELLKQYKLLETKSCSHESGSKATPVLKKVRQCSNQPARVEAVECAGYAPA